MNESEKMILKRDVMDAVLVFANTSLPRTIICMLTTFPYPFITLFVHSFTCLLARSLARSSLICTRFSQTLSHAFHHVCDLILSLFGRWSNLCSWNVNIDSVVLSLLAWLNPPPSPPQPKFTQFLPSFFCRSYSYVHG